MISVLCPSRGRPGLLRDSLRSLGSGSLEVLVRVDGCDSDLPAYADLAREVGCRILVGPRHGYTAFHRYVNELAEAAAGDWLLLWNDDARMRSGDWAERVEAQASPVPVCLNFREQPGQNWFPAINRAFYQAQGHFSLSPHCDSWVQDVANAAECHMHVPGVDIEHLRDTLDDATKQESAAAYAYTSPPHYGPEMSRLKWEDVLRISEARKAPR